MTMNPWLSVVLLGIALFGFAWMMPKRSQGEEGSGLVGDAAYDRLLEDLELENRELVDAVAKFKQEQDQTVHRLGNRIIELERQMKVWMEQAVTVPVPAPVAAAAVQPSVTSAAPAGPAVAVTVAQLPPFGREQVSVPESALPSTSIRVRYAELLALHNKGRSMDQIAKTVGMNKGEVQLILQLARREEEQLA